MIFTYDFVAAGKCTASLPSGKRWINSYSSSRVGEGASKALFIFCELFSQSLIITLTETQTIFGKMSTRIHKMVLYHGNHTL